MEDLRSAHRKAQDRFVETFSGSWPWVRKRRAVKSCIGILDQLEKEKPVSKYKVTLGYEKFPQYDYIRQEGDWFIFYDCDGTPVTFRHKGESVDHTIQYQAETVEAIDEGMAICIAKERCLHHVVYSNAEYIKGA